MAQRNKSAVLDHAVSVRPVGAQSLIGESNGLPIEAAKKIAGKQQVPIRRNYLLFTLDRSAAIRVGNARKLNTFDGEK